MNNHIFYEITKTLFYQNIWKSYLKINVYEKKCEFNITNKINSYENIIKKTKKNLLWNYIHMNENDEKINSYDLYIKTLKT